jgi:hypothetical protein
MWTSRIKPWCPPITSIGIGLALEIKHREVLLLDRSALRERRSAQDVQLYNSAQRNEQSMR